MSSPQDESLFDLAQGLGLPDLPENIEDEECVSLIECQESNTLSALENSSTVSNEAAHQLDLIDQFDLGETNIMFKEYNDTDEEPEAVNAIHSDVELPDLATFDIPEKQPTATEDKGERDSIPNVLCDGVTVKMEIAEPPEPLEAEIEQTFKGTPSVEQSLPDVIDIVESIKSAIPDHPNEWTTKTQEENVPSLMVKEVDNSTCPATDTQPAVGSTDNLKDEQIRLLRETLQSISNLLSESIGVDKCEIPNELNDTSAKEMVSYAASVIAQLNEQATRTTTSTSPISTQTGSSTKTSATSNVLATTNAVTKGETNDATATATKETLLTSEEEEWEEVREENHPAPDYGLESPVISHLLTTWTTDTSKIEFLRSWVRSLYMPSYEHLNYPPGLQITNLSNVLKDGFMVLLVPLIRALSKPKVVVHVKRHLASQYSSSSIQHNNQNQHQMGVGVPAHNHSEATGRSVSHDSTDVSSHLSTDPFANDILYDIRIKRLDVTLGADSGLPGATEGGYMIDHTAARQFFRKNSQSRVDTQYYSPLSEINSALPAIEVQTKRRIFDHAPESKTIPSVASSRPPPYRSSSPPSGGPRYKSFDAGPRLNSYERDYVSAEIGTTWERSASFSVASGSDAGAGYVVPAAAPSILQSIYTWWGAAPLPTPALLSENEENTASVASESTLMAASAATTSILTPTPLVETVPDKAAAGGTPTLIVSGQLSGSSSTASIASATDNTESTASKTATSSATASPARAPVNKIAERLQKIRDQKQPQT